MAKVERMAAELPVPTYAIDDETAIKVVDRTGDIASTEPRTRRIGYNRPVA